VKTEEKDLKLKEKEELDLKKKMFVITAKKEDIGKTKELTIYFFFDSTDKEIFFMNQDNL
jgi:hypothetical protein